MKILNTLFVPTLFVVGFLPFANARAERVLITDVNQTVSLSQSLDCYRPANIRIDTSNPEIYQSDPQALQAVSDAVRAILSFECPGLSEIDITGMIRGLDETVYRGSLSARDDWRVKPTNEAPRSYRDPGMALTTDSPLSIVGLRLGMTREQVETIIMNEFGVMPEYQAVSGLMTMQTGGCPANFSVKADAKRAQTSWKCLEARFSDTRVPKLTQIDLLQVVNSDTQAVLQRLRDKYGNPDSRTHAVFSRETELAWQPDNEPDHGLPGDSTLKAVLSGTDRGLLVTRLTLSAQSVRTLKSTGIADIGLRL